VNNWPFGSDDSSPGFLTKTLLYPIIIIAVFFCIGKASAFFGGLFSVLDLRQRHFVENLSLLTGLSLGGIYGAFSAMFASTDKPADLFSTYFSFLGVNSRANKIQSLFICMVGIVWVICFFSVIRELKRQ